MLGAGGMGEVYRARDRRLEREVAIKVLPAHLSSNAQFRERFDREARAISQITHPNICTLYDVGHEQGTSYLVMELLDGESLADRLSKGPLPIEQVLRYGMQIAEALDRAHRHGIVHRDLKPGNIMLTRSGAKLLDFGLAKAATANPQSSDGTTAAGATLAKPLTQEGTILGTYQYMAPEQLEGVDADARSDIFALGAVLYEMATGKRAFEGKTKTSLIVAIVSSEPAPMSRVQPVTPASLEHVVARCLAKDPEDRWQSARDIAQELGWIAQSSGATDVTRGRTIRRWPRAAGAAMCGLLIGAAAVWFALHGRRPDAAVARFSIALPPNAPLLFGGETSVAISHDGSRVIYRAKDGEKSHLYLRGIGQLVPTLIPNTENATMPVFSPDGLSILFNNESKLQKLRLDGGLPVGLASIRAEGGNLGSDWIGGSIYYNSGFTDGVSVISENGGEARKVIAADPAHGMRAIVWPQVLPGAKTIIATVWNNGTWDDAKIFAFPLNGGAPRMLIDGGSCGRYVASGHLVFNRGGTLFAAPFDVNSLAVTGSAVPVVQGVTSGTSNGDTHYAISDNGTLAYVPGSVIRNQRALLWVNRAGVESQVVPTPRPYADPVLSPDGRTIAVTLETATFDIWLLDLERDSLSRLSFGGDDSSPRWTPDGRRVIWRSSRSGHNNLYWAAADGSSSEERLTSAPYEQMADAVSPDGRLLLASEYHGEATNDIMAMPLAGAHTMQPVVASRFNERLASFSPDAHWIAYISNESGTPEAYLRPFPGPGGKWQVSVGGATACRFAHNGREIFYTNGGKFFVAPIELQPQVRIGRPQFLFDKQYRGWSGVTADDQRLLVVRDLDPPTANEFRIVLNWFDDLQRRAPR